MGSILKHNVVSGLGAQVTKFSLADVRIEANIILQNARKEADAIRSQATAHMQTSQQQAKTILANAEKEGFQKGYTEGIESGKKIGSEDAYAKTYEEAKEEFAQQSKTLFASLNEMLSKFTSQRDHMIAHAQQELLGLALAVAKKVTHRQLEIDENIVLENIKSAVSLVSSRSKVIVKINPVDMERFELMDAENNKRLLNLRDINVTTDENVDIGGCVVDTENGSIDAQVASQLQTIIQQLSPAMEKTINQWSMVPASVTKAKQNDQPSQEDQTS